MKYLEAYGFVGCDAVYLDTYQTARCHILNSLNFIFKSVRT
jgi:hypothetical protein